MPVGQPLDEPLRKRRERPETGGDDAIVPRLERVEIVPQEIVRRRIRPCVQVFRHHVRNLREELRPGNPAVAGDHAVLAEVFLVEEDSGPEIELLKRVAVLELAAHRNHFPGELSLGLARRVALARAFAIEPDFLILDEPLASLDDALAVRLREQIATLVDSRCATTLLVTHDVDDAIRLGDRLFLLSPRPARILAELPIRTPRSARSQAEIAAIKADVARRTNGDRAERDA